MTVEFLGLPQEIQSLIINYVDATKKDDAFRPDYWPIEGTISKADIASLSLCCKALRSICLPALFRDIHVSKIIPKLASASPEDNIPPVSNFQQAVPMTSNNSSSSRSEEDDKSLHDYIHSGHLTNVARYVISPFIML